MARNRNKNKTKQSEYKYERKKAFEYNGFSKEDNHTPMKDRFFSQNYNHFIQDIEEPSKSYAYQLDMNEDDYRKLLKMSEFKDIDLEFEPHVLSFIKSAFIVMCDWDNFEKDMLALSRKNKNILIRVKFWSEEFPDCIDEVNEDYSDMIDKGYMFDEDSGIDAGVFNCINGNCYVEEARVIWPEFDYSLLMGD